MLTKLAVNVIQEPPARKISRRHGCKLGFSSFRPNLTIIISL